MSICLKVEHLMMNFGGIKALDDVCFEIASNRITSIIGPNGAGKTTLFNCLTGFYKPSSGKLSLYNKDDTFFLEQMEGYDIAKKAKIARTFQNIRLFPNMTVLENLLVAQHHYLMKASGYSILGLFSSRGYKTALRKAVDKSMYWLNEMNLYNYGDNNACNLPYGAQRRLEIARALCTDPTVLCLDEPAAGLNHSESEELNKLLLKIQKELNITILLIEHDMNVVMGISDHIVVLDYGRKIADDVPSVIKSHPDVIRAYLGQEPC